MAPSSRARPACLSLVLAIALLASACVGSASTPPATAQLSAYPSLASASPGPSFTPRLRALSSDAARVLAYLGRLTDDSEPGFIVGQNCSNSGLICDDATYLAAIAALHAQSGKWVGILSLDYESDRVHSPAELSAANRRLIAHWQAGGLVMVTWDPANPWAIDPDQAWRDMNVQYPGADLHSLLPGGLRRDQWLASLARIADALTELRDAGVVVLWRPMQEMNLTSFWWAKTYPSEDHQVFIDLWRDMFDYFTWQRGLDNLLWVFAPAGSQFYSSFPYPGDSYVDVVAGTGYEDDLTIWGYEDYLAYGKPVAMSEYGPTGWGPAMKANGSFDDRLYVERLRRDYPAVAFFVVWNDWPGVKMALASNLHARELMNDPDVITRDEIDWR